MTARTIVCSGPMNRFLEYQAQVRIDNKSERSNRKKHKNEKNTRRTHLERRQDYTETGMVQRRLVRCPLSLPFLNRPRRNIPRHLLSQSLSLSSQSLGLPSQALDLPSHISPRPSYNPPKPPQNAIWSQSSAEVVEC